MVVARAGDPEARPGRPTHTPSVPKEILSDSCSPPVLVEVRASPPVDPVSVGAIPAPAGRLVTLGEVKGIAMATFVSLVN